MKYNFDEQIDRRNTNALNTDGFRGYIFHAGPEKVFPYITAVHSEGSPGPLVIIMPSGCSAITSCAAKFCG